jgi:ABC-type polysaccharide/polyol phosphate transport system ATPase subunit
MSSSELAISAQGLSKQYRIGSARRTSLREEFTALVRRQPRNAGQLIWALRDVSFEVQRGEIVGICGRNGAGKSTLLKILSRVTEPTEGRAVLNGRVSSLLEVGTGFHPELTGRENIFLNGSLLGMAGPEVQAQLEAIAEFSVVGKFLETPVKYYSSGMQARLGFAVAAHLRQDILILDEVLAVGDAAFQRKCLDTVHDIARAGRTILMVSHNMFAVERFCHRALLLDEGQIRDSGPPQRIIEKYLAAAESEVRDTARAGDQILAKHISIKTDAAPGRLRGAIVVQIDVECLAPLDHLDCGISISNSANQVLASGTARFGALAAGAHRLVMDVANPGLPPGDYSMSFAVIRRDHWLKIFGRAAPFRIPTMVTDDPHMLQFLDLSGIALEIRRAHVDAARAGATPPDASR